MRGRAKRDKKEEDGRNTERRENGIDSNMLDCFKISSSRGDGDIDCAMSRDQMMDMKS